MALGELHKCWVCWESKAWDAKLKNEEFTHTCTPVRGKKRTIAEGCFVWLCSDCKKNFNA